MRIEEVVVDEVVVEFGFGMVGGEIAWIGVVRRVTSRTGDEVV